ncbi:MAG TPA: TMEM175 family protein [Anaerolineales bacterium]|nr:TMEM175 family protein [Anaerolineales bacterium]
MGKGRLEAFSDGVIAILITIMVLELPRAEGVTLLALRPLAPKLVVYAFSFILLGIYWNNHHHLLQVVQRVNGAVLWANLHLLFWLSLIPWVTAWAGDHGLVSLPVSIYGAVMLLSAVAYFILVRALLASQPRDSRLAAAIGSDTKGRISMLIYALGMGLSFVQPLLGWACYVIVALIWLVPDMRIERVLSD